MSDPRPRDASGRRRSSPLSRRVRPCISGCLRDRGPPSSIAALRLTEGGSTPAGRARGVHPWAHAELGRALVYRDAYDDRVHKRAASETGRWRTLPTSLLHQSYRSTATSSMDFAQPPSSMSATTPTSSSWARVASAVSVLLLGPSVGTSLGTRCAQCLSFRAWGKTRRAEDTQRRNRAARPVSEQLSWGKSARQGSPTGGPCHAVSR